MKSMHELKMFELIDVHTRALINKSNATQNKIINEVTFDEINKKKHVPQIACNQINRPTEKKLFL